MTTPGPRQARWLLWATCALFVAGILRHARFVPVWDSAQYVDCLMDATHARSWRALNCFKHPTIAYMSVLALPQLATGGSLLALHVTNALLGVFALVSFHSVARRLVAGPLDAELATACFAALPMLSANVLDPTPDYGVMVFLLAFVAALAADRPLAATLAGLALVLSKESGMMLYGTTVVSFLAAHVPGRVSVGALRRLVWRWSGLVVPVLFAAAFLFGGNKDAVGGGGLWNGLGPLQALRMMLRLDLDRALGSQAAALFVMGFGWVATLFVAAWLALGPFKVTGYAQARVDGRRLAAALGLSLLLGFAVLTRFPTFSHPRYLLGLFPLWLLTFARALSTLVRAPLARRGVAVAVACLFLVSQARTVDPVSKALWGTWRFGAHDVLRVTGISRECCGNGLDGLVYNLQFVRLHDLLDELLPRLAPTGDDVFLVPRDTNWQVLNHLDASSARRALGGLASFKPRVHSVELGPPPPARRYLYVAIPTADPATATARVRQHFKPVSSETAEQDGYRLEALVVAPREDDSTAVP